MARTITEDRYVIPTIETVRVVNVNINAWSVDVVSELGNKLYFDIQVMSPYFNYFNGEGVYCMPEVGAIAWLCKPSQGRFSEAFILGFQAPFDQENLSYRCGRQNLNPGDIMMTTRDENFIILRRGGVIQIGATPIAQRMFIPIRNFIKDFCENYELTTLGGEMSWIVERTDQTTDGKAPAKLSFNIKEFANEPSFIASLTMGSHGDGSDTTIELSIKESGAKDAAQKLKLTLTKAGDATWELEGSWDLYAKQKVSLKADQEVSIESSNSDVSVKAGANVNIEATQSMTLKAIDSKVQAQASHTVECSNITLGGQGALPVAIGVYVVQALTSLASVVDGALTKGACASAIAAALPMIPAQTTKAK